MRRLAIFVEGYTEEIFIINLLTKLANERKIAFEIKRQKFAKLIIAKLPSMLNPEWYIQIVNCNTDNQVKFQIINNYSSLSAKGYDGIIGILDVYPKKHSDITKLQKYLRFGLPSGSTPISIHLVILEIESWFIQEITHFQRIDPSLTFNVIKNSGFDHENMPASDIDAPAQKLHEIYQLAGKQYTKTRPEIHRTIEALDFNEVLTSVRSKSASFHEVMNSIENGLKLVN